MLLFSLLLLPGLAALEPGHWRAINQLDLSRILEGAEKDLGNSSSCLTKLRSLATFSDPLESLAFFDSMGKPASGLTRNLLGLNLLGNYDQCMGLRNSTLGYYDWCSARFQVNASVGANALVTPVHWTMCLPLECQEANLTSLVDSLFAQVTTLTGGMLAPNSYTLVCNEDDSYTPGAYVGMALAGLFTGLVLLSSIYRAIQPLIDSLLTPRHSDYTLLNSSEEDMETSDSITTAKREAARTLTTFDRLVRCFALQDTFADLTNTETKKGQVLCMNGIRVLSINWVVLGHTYMYFFNQASDMTYMGELMSRRNFETILNAQPSVDSFFVMSGFLVSYLLLKQLKKNGRLSGGEWVMYYVHRYVRLTIPYLMVILIEGFCYQVWFTGPQRGDIQGIPGCHDSWWTNLLYIQNVYPWRKNETAKCLGQAWYLANDMQFYILAPLFILPLFYKPLLGGLMTMGSVIAGAGGAAYIAYHFHLSPTSTYGDGFWLLYNKPYIRITPYLVGIAGGWFYFAHGETLTRKIRSMPMYLRVIVAAPLWIVTCAVEYFVVYGLYDDIQMTLRREEVPLVDGITYHSLARIGWALALGIQILLCQFSLSSIVNALLSWKGWLVLSRLTYPVYLVHYGLLGILSLQMRGTFYYQPSFQTATFYLGVLFVSYLCAVVLHLTVELPMSKLERVLYR